MPNFEAIAREWIDVKRGQWEPKITKDHARRLEIDVFPSIGSRPIKEITAPELLAVIRVIENRGATDLSRKILGYCSKVFTYAIATGKAVHNPAIGLNAALKTHVKNNHAHLTPSEVQKFINDLEIFNCGILTKLATKMLLLTFVRTSELLEATWDEVDLEKSVWNIPLERMKMRRDHTVPLSKQAVEILKELHLINGRWKYVFPNRQQDSPRHASVGWHPEKAGVWAVCAALAIRRDSQKRGIIG